MKFERMNPPGILNHPGFTRIITVSGPAKMIFISGMTPEDENAEPVHVGDMKGQYLFIMENLTKQLEAAGATWEDVTYRRLFLTDVPGFQKMRRENTFPKYYNDPSCSTMIGVTALAHPDFMIEMDLMAAVPE